MKLMDIIKLWLQKNLLLFEDSEKFRTVTVVRVVSLIVLSITGVAIYQLCKGILNFDIGFVVGIFAIFISWLFFWSSHRIQTHQAENLFDFLRTFRQESKESFEKIHENRAEVTADKTDQMTAPTAPSAVEIPTELSREAKRILATLWKYQQKTFQDDLSRRWGFRILPNTKAYGTFIIGFAELIELGLVAWTPKDGHCMLTDKGIDFVKAHPNLQKSDDIYPF